MDEKLRAAQAFEALAMMLRGDAKPGTCICSACKLKRKGVPPEQALAIAQKAWEGGASLSADLPFEPEAKA